MIARMQNASEGRRDLRKLSTSPVRICKLPVYGLRRVVNEAPIRASGSAFTSIAKNAAAKSHSFAIEGLSSGGNSPSG